MNWHSIIYSNKNNSVVTQPFFITIFGILMSRNQFFSLIVLNKIKHELSCWLFSPVTIHHDRSPITKTVAYVNKQNNIYIYIYTHTHTHKRGFLFLSECSFILLRYVCITHPYFFPKIPPPWHWQQSLANDGAELWSEYQISKDSNTLIHTA